MRVKGITIAQLNECLAKVNKDKGYRLIYNQEPYMKGKYIHFTIRSEKSGIAGSRYSHSGRRLVSASWHSHGYLFDNIYDINEDAIIYAGTLKMTSREDNWQDRNIGSLFSPMYFSETSIL